MSTRASAESVPHSRRAQMPVFELSERDIWPGCREIEVEGELDLAVSRELQSALERASAKRLHVLVDLSGCEFIDISAVGVLVRGHEQLAARRCQLLLYGVAGQVRRLLAVTGLAGSNHGLAVSPQRPPAGQPKGLGSASPNVIPIGRASELAVGQPVAASRPAGSVS
jgi:anti-anti-sigma factor